jgi:putative ABC transport system substrate-binding protein
MDRRRFLLASLAGALGAPLAAQAQQPGKTYRVGILTNKAADPAEARPWQAFRSGLRERGWIEGENILIEFRGPRATPLGFQHSRPTWFGSRWT